MFSGQVTLKVPTRPLTFLSSSLSNVVVTPYALGGIGTPISGVGDANGSLAAIAGAGAAVDFCEVLGGELGATVAAVDWSNCGTMAGMRYYLGLTWHKGF